MKQWIETLHPGISDSILNSFRNHRAKLSVFKNENGEIQEIIWKNPKTSNNYISYVLHGNTLYVTGDRGDAVYTGLGYQSWYEHVAISRIEEYIKNDPGFEKVVNSASLYDEGWKNNISTKQSWISFVVENIDIITCFADCSLENVGMAISTDCIYHLQGLVCALNYLENSTKIESKLLNNKCLDYEYFASIKDKNNLIIKGDLDLLGIQKTEKLPDNLMIVGSLWLEHSDIQKLPNNLIVIGNLWLGYTQLKKLPNNLIVGGNLWIENTQIKELPNGLVVKGEIFK